MDEGLMPAETGDLPPAREALVPQDSPRVMPEQVFWADRHKGWRTHARVQLARVTLVLLWGLASGAFAWTLYGVLSVETPTVLQLVFWCLSTACFAWVAVGSASALIGFVCLIAQKTTDTLLLPAPRATAGARTALLFPVYREDAAAVAATVEAMCREIVAATAQDRFDVFILSDTPNRGERGA